MLDLEAEMPSSELNGWFTLESKVQTQTGSFEVILGKSGSFYVNFGHFRDIFAEKPCTER